MIVFDNFMNDPLYLNLQKDIEVQKFNIDKGMASQIKIYIKNMHYKYISSA